MIALAFEAAEPPLVPYGVVAIGEAMARLAVAALDRDDDEFAKFEGVANRDCIVLFCTDPAGLPWAEGCQYIGHFAHAPLLWFPTTLIPTLPVDLVVRAVRRAQGEGPSACVVLPVEAGPPRWISLRHRAPVDRQLLAQHAAAQ